MALKTNPGLLIFDQGLIFHSVANMTVSAGHPILLVHASVPAHPGIGLVALKTHAILLFRRISRLFPKVQNRCLFLVRSYSLCMFAPRPVTGLTL